MTPFGPTKRLQQEYEQAIRQVAARALPQQQPGQSLQDWLKQVAELGQQQDIKEASEELANRMVRWVDVRNAQSWRQAAARSMKSRKMYGLLQRELQGAVGARLSQITRENARLISSLPLEVATTFVGELTKAAEQGARPSTIAKMARNRFPKLLRSRINLISRTETAKASTALTQARSEELGVDFYIWLTSEDARVRLSHKKMNGVVVPWSQEPDPEALMGEKSTLGHYHAGGCPNCRCTQQVVLTLEDIQFPARVYWNGAVRRMNGVQFRQIAVNLERRAA